MLDHPSGGRRQSGPFKVKFGDVVEVTQVNAENAPSANVIGTGQPKGEIKVINKGGNAQPLEMALYKNGSKIVSFKDVNPANAVYLAIRPVIYIANVDDIEEGDDFKAANQASSATQFDLYSGKTKVNIQIKQNPNKQLVFSLVD